MNTTPPTATEVTAALLAATELHNNSSLAATARLLTARIFLTNELLVREEITSRVQLSPAGNIIGIQFVRPAGDLLHSGLLGDCWGSGEYTLLKLAAAIYTDRHLLRISDLRCLDEDLRQRAIEAIIMFTTRDAYTVLPATQMTA